MGIAQGCASRCISKDGSTNPKWEPNEPLGLTGFKRDDEHHRSSLGL